MNHGMQNPSQVCQYILKCFNKSEWKEAVGFTEIASGKQAEAFSHNKAAVKVRDVCGNNTHVSEMRAERNKGGRRKRTRGKGVAGSPRSPRHQLNIYIHLATAPLTRLSRTQPASEASPPLAGPAATLTPGFYFHQRRNSHFSFRDCLSFVVLPCLIETEFGVDTQQVGRWQLCPGTAPHSIPPPFSWGITTEVTHIYYDFAAKSSVQLPHSHKSFVTVAQPYTEGE